MSTNSTFTLAVIWATGLSLATSAAEVRKPVEVTLRATVQDIAPLTTFAGKVIPVDFDPRFALTMQIEVVAGTTNWTPGAVVTFAIHSPVRLFAGEPVKGKIYAFALDQETLGDRLKFSGLRLQPDQLNVPNIPESRPLPARRVLRLAPGPDNPRNSEGDFIPLKDGRLKFVYTRFTGGAGDHARADLASRESVDGGLTWSQTDRVEIRNEGTWNIMSVSLLRLKSGRIALFYLRKNSLQDCRPLLRYSDDETATWSAPTECITDETGYYVLNNDRVIQLAGGRLIVPVAQHTKAGEKALRDGLAMCYLSDDEGKTWRRGKSVLSGDAQGRRINLMEPGVVELADGRVLMVLRTKLGCQYMSWSKDGGETWSAPAPSALESPESPATIERIHGTPDLLAVWNDHRGLPEAHRRAHPPVRTPLALAVSRDGGLTWGAAKILEADPASGYCYTALEFVGRRVLLGYCAHRSRWGLETTQITAIELDEVTQP